MSKTKSYTQLKADLARIAEQEAAIKKQIADAEKKQKEVAQITIGKTFLAFFSDEDLLCKSSADLKQFVQEVCETAVENRDRDESEDMTDEEESESQNKSHRPYNPMFGA